jgi:hypothetical protein
MHHNTIPQESRDTTCWLIALHMNSAKLGVSRKSIFRKINCINWGSECLLKFHLTVYSYSPISNCFLNAMEVLEG